MQKSGAFNTMQFILGATYFCDVERAESVIVWWMSNGVVEHVSTLPSLTSSCDAYVAIVVEESERLRRQYLQLVFNLKRKRIKVEQ